jgi:hypothetical protein
VIQKLQVLNTLIVVCTFFRRLAAPSLHVSVVNPVIPQNQVLLEMPVEDRLKFIVKAAVNVLPGLCHQLPPSFI